jgi:hypothetical protein
LTLFDADAVFCNKAGGNFAECLGTQGIAAIWRFGAAAPPAAPPRHPLHTLWRKGLSLILPEMAGTPKKKDFNFFLPKIPLFFVFTYIYVRGCPPCREKNFKNTRICILAFLQKNVLFEVQKS